MGIRAVLVNVMFVTVIGGCSLPPVNSRVQSQYYSVQEVSNTRLAAEVLPLLEEHPGLSGFAPIQNALDAFTARRLLIEAADKSLDVQYYIWRDDLTGTLLLNYLYEAAKRGVRVRLLLDDHGSGGLDDWLSALNNHENIEVRLFNPFPFRLFKLSRFLWDFSLANRRMHNKSFTADNLMSVVGGRNVGDEYFGATEGLLFSDADILAIGPIVTETSADFDKFWQSPLAYPLEQLVSPKKELSEQEIRKEIQRASQRQEAQKYLAKTSETEFVTDLTQGLNPFRFSQIDLLSDSPDKIIDPESAERSFLEQLDVLADNPQINFDVVSPYFVPGESGAQSFIEMQKRGVKVRILTNAGEATDVKAVHAGYMKYRKRLLEAGIEIYEMKRFTSTQEQEKAGLFGSSGSSLHAKTFAKDAEKVFVGSFNFDPRSANLNTEMGYLIHHPGFSQELHTVFDQNLESLSYRLVLTEKGELGWQRSNGEVLTKEPGQGFWSQLWLTFLGRLPIEWLL